MHRAAGAMSQSLRESGRFVRYTEMIIACHRRRRNPFVNQVVSFKGKNHYIAPRPDVWSQSLRESGRFVRLSGYIATIIACHRSHSLRE